MSSVLHDRGVRYRLPRPSEQSGEFLQSRDTDPSPVGPYKHVTLVTGDLRDQFAGSGIIVSHPGSIIVGPAVLTGNWTIFTQRARKKN
jgi:hypothetical protein